MSISRILWYCMLMLSATIPGVTVGAYVEGMQSPAWLERQGSRQPLEPGISVQSGDRVVTGMGARVLLRLDEGSQIKLGENAVFGLEAWKSAQQGGGVWRGLMNVIKGAFRMTTGLLKQMDSRDLRVRISAVTVGIRGTDIWGKSTPDQDIVCLIEGNIEVQHKGKLFSMEDPLSFFVAPRVGNPKPVGPVPEEKLRKWSEQTELQAGKGVLSPDGLWVVNLMEFRDENQAEQAKSELLNQGYPVEMVWVEFWERRWYRIRIKGFASYADAMDFATQARDRLGAPDARVAQR
jgi:hypothetical protein